MEVTSTTVIMGVVDEGDTGEMVAVVQEGFGALGEVEAVR